MKKYQIIFTLSVWLLFILNFYSELLPLKKNPTVYLEDLNKSVINFEEQLVLLDKNFHSNNFRLWDMKISELLDKREINSNAKLKEKIIDLNLNSEIKEKRVNVENRTICIEEKCWQLMGILTLNGVKSLTLLSKETKPKLQIFKVGEELLPQILIKDIRGEQMILLNKEKNKTIILKLFDVKISKYRPKEVKVNNE